MVSTAIDVADVSFGDVGPDTATKARKRLLDAAGAYERERFGDARRMLESVNRLAPDVPEVLELMGLCAYRTRHWKKAINELGRFHELTGSVDQHPVIADSHRAMKHWNAVEDTWTELAAASPHPAILEEGRIVLAGAKADQGRIQDAIRILENANRTRPKKPKIHHLRSWYALADLYERAGIVGNARRLFADIAQADPDFGDAAKRSANLK
ncbi:MAG: tetratricopeptide repeat protein [Acidimicrobiales bacterium]